MPDQFSRTARMLGDGAMRRLHESRVAVFGIGGVGGHCVEALARTGVGAIGLFDSDRVDLTNLNRQIIAAHSTVGRYKVDVMRERILDINPDAVVGAHRVFYSPETAEGIDLSGYDYIVDAVDTVTAKLELVCRAGDCSVPVISSMGAANKMDPSTFEVADIYATSVCPLARIMRRELRKRGVDALKVVYSREIPLTPLADEADSHTGHPTDTAGKGIRRRQIPASNAFVPAVAGLIMAGEVVRDLIGYGALRDRDVPAK